MTTSKQLCSRVVAEEHFQLQNVQWDMNINVYRLTDL